MTLLILGVLVSYLIGSLPTAYLVGRMVKGIDIRKHGSGNVGATNVFRVVGRKWGILVLILDAFKGAFTSMGVSVFLPPPGVPPFLAALIYGSAAIAGHTWTFWLGFQGGKGVATSAGVFLALAPKPALVALLVWTVVFGWKRYVSLASLVTAVAFPICVFLFYRESQEFKMLFPISLGLTLFIFYTHQENIQRLRRGEERPLV